MKNVIALLLVVFIFTGCNDKAVELVTVTASAYLDNSKAVANFAIISPNQTATFADASAVARFFATVQQNSKTGISDFSAKVLPGEYVLIIQLKDGTTGVYPGTYTYNFITNRGPSAKLNYVMQFNSGQQTSYQHWEDRK